MNCDVGEALLFSKLSVASATSQLILQPFLALPTLQLIFQSFRCFTYVTAHFPTLISLLLLHRLFTYVTWRVAHGWEFLIYIPIQAFPYLSWFLIYRPPKPGKDFRIAMYSCRYFTEKLFCISLHNHVFFYQLIKYFLHFH